MRRSAAQAGPPPCCRSATHPQPPACVGVRGSAGTGARRGGAAALGVILLGSLHAPALHAHGGGLDDLRCHNNWKQGGYHCHGGSPLGEGAQFASEEEARRAYAQLVSGGSGGGAPGNEDDLTNGTPAAVAPGAMAGNPAVVQRPEASGGEARAGVAVALLAAMVGGVATGLVDALVVSLGRRRLRWKREAALVAGGVLAGFVVGLFV